MGVDLKRLLLAFRRPRLLLSALAAKVLLSALRTRFGTKRCAKRRRRRAMSVCA